MKTAKTTKPLDNTQPEIVQTLIEVGTDWARQGIDMGISAVRTQAGLFETLSKTLTKAADALAVAAKPLTDAPTATDAAEVIDTTATTEPAAPPARKRRSGPAAQA